jgi:hypothetical protein
MQLFEAFKSHLLQKAINLQYFHHLQIFTTLTVFTAIYGYLRLQIQKFAAFMAAKCSHWKF